MSGTEPSDIRTDQKLLDYLWKEYAKQRPGATRSASSQRSSLEKEVDIKQEIARSRKLKNDDAEQDIKLKRKTLNRLFLFLTTETIVIFVFAFFQAVYWPAKFHLDNWSFKLLISATLLQITGMLFVAVRYLFPKRS